MKKIKTKQKWVLRGLNVAIVIMSVLVIIVGGLNIGIYYNEMKAGYRVDRFLNEIKDGNYSECVEKYYSNEKKGYKANEDLLECYGVAKYYEAAFYYKIYEQTGDAEKAKDAEAKMDAAYQEMGSLSPVKEKIDKVLGKTN